MTLEFDAERHLYTVDGKPVPSVTQLVAPLGEDYDEPEEALEGVLDAAADRGVTMHDYIAFRLSGGLPGAYELPSIYEPYATAVELFLAEHKIEPILVETALGCATFAGTPDLVCWFDGETAIVDYKFVSQVAKSKVGAQLAGYQALCDCNGLYTERLYAVQFLGDGTYRLYPVEAYAASIVFEGCRDIYRYKTHKHPKGRIFGDLGGQKDGTV